MTLIALRTLTGRVIELIELIPDGLNCLAVIQPGQCFYLFTDAAGNVNCAKAKSKNVGTPVNEPLT
jgi:hypothetical protein